MATEIDWASIPGQRAQSSGGGQNDKFLRFKGGDRKIVRPIGKVVTFVKFYVERTKRSVVVNVALRDEATQQLSAHFGEEIKPSKRYAVNVIDRTDGKFRILEGPESLFEHFGVWSQTNNNQPCGGMGGWDFSITATGEKKNRRYSVTPVRPSPFSKAEAQEIKDSGKCYNLNQVFEGVSLDELVDKATGNWSTGPAEADPVAAGGVVETEDDQSW